MPADYFVEDDYRAVIGDRRSPFRAEPADLDRAQSEVVERLEAWASSAWRPRVTSEVVRADVGEYPLSRLPVRQITSVTLDGVAVTDYVLWPSGVVRFGTGYPFTYPEDRWYPFSGYGRLAITYSYGFDEPNWTVKRAAILATHSLLNDIAGSPESSKLPSNTSRYSVSNTTLELDPASSQTDTQPWPWDVRASNLVTTYWGPRRPTRFISAV